MKSNTRWYRAFLTALFIPLLIISCNQQNSSPVSPENDFDQGELSVNASEAMSPQEIMDPMGTDPLYIDQDPKDFKFENSSKLKTSSSGYEINELTRYTTSGQQYSFASEISNTGYILGRVYTGSEYRWVTWYNNQITLLESFPNSYNNSIHANDINDAGQAVGYGFTSDNYYHAMMWESDGSIIDIGTLPGATYTYATGINNNGKVTGFSYTSNGQRGFIWDEVNGIVDIGLPNSQAFEVVPQAINDNGTVVGYYRSYNSNNHWYRGAFIWNEVDGFTDYISFGVATTTFENVIPRDINNNGQIVGDAYNLVNHDNGAFFFDPNIGFTSLNNDGDSNTYYYAQGVNNSGIVIGYYRDYNINYQYTATQWDEQNGLIDLGYLDTNTQNYNYSVGRDINDNAEVVGYSYDENGYLTAVIWNGDGSGGSGQTNTAPVADAGADQSIEATGPTTSVSLDGSASTDADGDSLTYSWSNGDTNVTTTVNLGVGSHTFTLTVDDGTDSSSDDVTITITDTTAPDLTFTTQTNSLWPPNHKMVLVVSGISAYDIVDEATDVEIIVTSSEDANGNGDGNTEEDYEIVSNPDGSYDVYVRAERSGNGDGRIYTISLSTTDEAGNNSGDNVEVTVAGNQGNGKGGKKK